jgi:hypothetical protein
MNTTPPAVIAEDRPMNSRPMCANGPDQGHGIWFGARRPDLGPVEGAGRHRWPQGRAWRVGQPQAGDAATGLSGQRAGDLEDGGLATGGIVAELLDGEQAPGGVQPAL